MRLGRFVAELADSYEGPNFSSFLRVFCMLEGEQALAREILGPTHHGLLDVVTNCPNPGLILSRYRTVIAYNSAFGEWLGPANVAVIGAELTTLVQVRTRRSLNDVWQDLSSEEHTSELQSIMRISYAVFCLKTQKNKADPPPKT